MARGVVVAPQPRAAEAGARVLERGGNAFDAAIATAFVQMVVDPFMCGIGGMGTAHLYHVERGEHRVVDFHTRAGSRVRPDMWAKDMKGRTPISGYSLFDDYRSELGYTAIMVPGSVAGFAEVHRRYATLSWSDLLAPAIQTARDGFLVTPNLAGWLRLRQQPGVPAGRQRILASQECARLYLKPDGSLYQEGELLRNPDMADTFERLVTEGPDSFYAGPLGERVAQDLEANGAFVTAPDLASYRVRVGEPIATTYRGYTVASNPPPGGGAWVLEALSILEGFPLGAMEHNGADHLHTLAGAMRLAHADRNRYLGDPEFVDVPLDSIFLSKEHAAGRQRAIREGTVAAVASAPRSGTTQVTAVDAAGNVACITHTLGTSSGVVTPGLGFMYNNAMKLFDPLPGRANSMAPGKARTSGMCPTLVLKGGRPLFAVGAPGGSVIMSAVLQCICNVIDFGMTATEAVSAPRIHCEGEIVYLEGRVREDTVMELARRGHPVEHRVESYAPDFSRPQLARILGPGRFDAGSDPRGDGGGVVYAWGNLS